MTKKRVFSGAQPTGDSMHLGNYFGALRQWSDMQDAYDAIYCVVDQHAITVDYDPKTLPDRTRLTAAQYIGAGIDPQKAIIFIQSQVPEHSQLSWILNCITGVGEASRMTQYKDKSQKNGADKSTVGLFTYPILQAADILLYNANLIPVGEDQRQHIELTRDLGQRFNHRFGETFVIPEAYIMENSAKVFDLQKPLNKMSKSGDNPLGIVNLLDEDKTIEKKIKSAVTDDETVIIYDEENKPGVSNLLQLYTLLSGKSIDELEQEYDGKMYGHLKTDLASLTVEHLRPIRQKVRELLDDPNYLDAVLADGARRAHEIAEPHIKQVYERVGFATPL